VKDIGFENNNIINLGKIAVDSKDFYLVLKKIFSKSENLPFYYIYKELAKIYGYSTFTRSDLKSIIGNESIISKNILKEFEPVIGNGKPQIKERKNENLVSVTQNDRVEFYYCTKKRKIPIKDLIEKLLEYFDYNNIREVDFEQIYDYLRKVFKVKNLNRSNLQKFLNSHAIIKKDSIVELASKYLNKSNYYEQDIIKKRLLIAQSIKTLGLESIKYALKNDINYILRVLSIFQNKNYLETDLSKLKNAYDFLYAFLSLFSEEEAIEIFHNEEILKDAILAFIKEYKNAEVERKVTTQFRKAIENINPDNKKLIIKYILPYNISKLLEQQGLILLCDLHLITDEQALELYKKSPNILNYLEKLSLSIRETLSKTFFGIVNQKNKLGNVSKNWELYLSILSKRMEGNTLQTVGDLFCITRERVRQIEKKYIEAFNTFYNNRYGSISNILRAHSNNPNYITPNEIDSIIGTYSNLFIYLLKVCNLSDIAYIEELDIFYFPQDDLDWYKELLLETAKLPSIISKEDMEKTIDKMHNAFFDLGFEIPRDFCKKVMVQDYLDNNTFYSKNKLSLSEKYDIILRKYFKEGIHIYNEKEIEKFRDFYNKDFADNKLPINNRAIVARIPDVAILCDRGTYKPRQEKYISDELLEELYAFIVNYPREIILVNTLFYEFEDKLREQGVNNKYFLQGIIKQEYNDMLFFRRDYISKSREYTSIHKLVYDFIKESTKPLSKQDILEEFPALSNVILAFVVAEDDIINLFGHYIHKDKYPITEDDLIKIKNIMRDMVANGRICHSRDLLTVLVLEDKSMLERLFIENQYQLFSVLKTYLEDEFELQRPFFAEKGIIIERAEERLRDYLKSNGEVLIEDLTDYARENKLPLNSIIDFINSQNDTFIFKDKATISKIDIIGVNKYKLQFAEDILGTAMNYDDFLSLKRFNKFSLMPKINCEWNQWLLYSVINKWSDRFIAITSARQFKQSYVIVIKKELNIFSYDELIAHLRQKKALPEIEFIKYLRQKDLMD